MISRRTKTLYYTLMALPMKWNGILYRFFRAPRQGVVKVHLGPGQKKYIKGWINVDANCFTAKCDVWADLRNKFPFPDQSVDVIYSYGMIEHLPDNLLPFHFAEMYRCLKSGGCIRVAAPNGDGAIKKFIDGDNEWFGDWPDKRRSTGGRFTNFLLCRNEHTSILTFSYFQELAEDAGLVNIVRCSPKFETNHPDLIDSSVLNTESELPSREYPHILVVEGEKL